MYYPILKSSQIDGLKIAEIDTFNDHRGDIWTVFSENMIDEKFVEDKVTVSKKNVLRGFHGDSVTDKLVTCLLGRIQFVVIDLRKKSRTYLMKEEFIIDSSKPIVVLVPKGCVNAHLCLSDQCVFFYKWSKQYAGPENQITIAWDDPDLDICWEVADPILSDRDRKGQRLKGALL